MIHLHHKLLGAIAAATIACTSALVVPAMAADTAPTTQSRAKTGIDPVEAQVTRLHDQLHITAAQTEQFNALAQVMRDNRTSHAEQVKEKRQNEANMTALEDMQAYAEIAQNHADGAKKLATAFETLYSSLSDDQKKAADEAFRQHKRRVMRHVTQKSQ
jgi:hypothetical protein